MIVDSSPTGSDPGTPPSSQPEPRGKTITCEACESTLHASGDVKKKSDSLKALEKAAGTSDGWKTRAEKAEAEIARRDALPHAGPDAVPHIDPVPLPASPKKKHLHLSVSE